MSLTSPDVLDSKQAQSWHLEARPTKNTACFKLTRMLFTFSAPSRSLWSRGGVLETTDPISASVKLVGRACLIVSYHGTDPPALWAALNI